MRRRQLLALTAVGAGLAGCTTSEAEDETATPTSTSTDTPTAMARRGDSSSQESPADNDQIECGQSYMGELTEADETGFRSDGHYQDVYTFEADAGIGIQLSMHAFSGGKAYMYLLDPEGDILKEEPIVQEPGGAFFRYPLEQAGTYTIIVTSVEEGATFAYDMYVGCFSAKEELHCESASIGALTETDETGFHGECHYQDTHSFNGSANQDIGLGMYTQDEQAFPYLYLRDPDGTVVAESDTASEREARLEHSLNQTGEYTIITTSTEPNTFFVYILDLSCGSGEGN